MAEIKITSLAAISDPASTDVLPIVDVSADITNKISIEDLLKNAVTGSASSPSFAFDGDSNTGMYRSGADALAFSTGGTGRLFIDSSGNVGVGTGSPSSELHITDGTVSRSFQYLASTNELYLSSEYDASGSTTDLFTLITRSSGNWRHGGLVKSGTTISLVNSNTNSDITTGDGLTVDVSGNVGIGTSSPAISKLHINQGAETYSINLQNNSSNESGIVFGRYASPSASSVSIVGNGETTGYLKFISGGEAMRIDSSGNVGIGTSTPAATVHIANADPQFRLQRTGDYSTSAGPLIQFQGKGPNGTNYNFGKIQAVSSGSNNAGVLQFFTNSAGAQTERMRIDSSGNVGIGTTAPAELLTVNGTDKSAMIRTSNSTGTAKLKFNADDVNYAGVGLENTALVFRCSNNSSPTERMRIDSSGRLLVGTSSSTTADSLVLNGNSSGSASQSTIRMRRTGAISSGAGISLIEFASTATRIGGSIECYADDAWSTGDTPGRLVFSTTADGSSSPTERMRIDSSGRVGIGETNLTKNLVIKASTDPEMALKTGNDSTGRAFYSFDNSSGSTRGYVGYNFGNDYLNLSVAGSERMRIDSSGNVGIGESSPSHLLDVKYQTNRYFQVQYGKLYSHYDDNALIDTLTLRNTGCTANGHGAKIHFIVGSSSSSNSSFITAQQDTAAGSTNLTFGVNNTEAMRITKDARVGIGTSSPAQKLVVNNGTDNSDVAVFTGGDVNRGLKISTAVNGGVNDSIVVFNAQTSTTGAFAFKTQGAERVGILKDGGLTFNGDTAQANALDDYEEGTWTPSLDSGGFTLSGSSVATYTKIGNMVHVYCYVSLVGTGTNTTMTFSGLPFNAASEHYTSGGLDAEKKGVKGMFSRISGGGVDELAFFYPSESTAQRIEMKGTDFLAGYFIFSVTYRAA